MRSLCLLLLSSLALSVHAEDATPTPLAVVEARMAAVNAQDLEAFLALYADDVEIYIYPNKPLTSGKARLAEIFGPLLGGGDAEAVIHQAITVDAFVIIKRTISFGDTSEPGVAIYEVRDGLIQSVQFVRDSRRALQVPRRSGS